MPASHEGSDMLQDGADVELLCGVFVVGNLEISKVLCVICHVSICNAASLYVFRNLSTKALPQNPNLAKSCRFCDCYPLTNRG